MNEEVTLIPFNVTYFNPPDVDIRCHGIHYYNMPRSYCNQHPVIAIIKLKSIFTCIWHKFKVHRVSQKKVSVFDLTWQKNLSSYQNKVNCIIFRKG